MANVPANDMDEYVELAHDGSSFVFDIETRSRKRSLAYHFLSEEHVWRDFLNSLNESDVVWDVGAHYGIYSIPASETRTSGSVYAFEPNPHARDVLSKNCRVNGSDIEISRVALANDSGDTAMRMKSRGGDTAVIDLDNRFTDDERYAEEVIIERTSGDRLVEERSYEVPDVIKIDVEGAEPLVIEGITELLIDCRLIYVEVHKPTTEMTSVADFGYSVAELLSMIRNSGYELRTLYEGPDNMIVKAIRQ